MLLTPATLFNLTVPLTPQTRYDGPQLMLTAPLRNALIVTLLLLAAFGTYLSSRSTREAELSTPTKGAGSVATLVNQGPGKGTLLTVEMTAYTSDVAQTDSTPRITASGALVSPGIAAASRDLLEAMPYGSQVEVLSVSGEGCGGWVPETPLTVADTMSAEIENHLDVWLETNELALAWGRCEAEIRVSLVNAE